MSLPCPDEEAGLESYFSQTELISTIDKFSNWKSYRPPVLELIENEPSNLISKNWLEPLTSPISHQLSWYSLMRANHQLNEAINKVCATFELVTKQHDTFQVPDFDNNFSMGTVLPAIYYAQVSSIVSILSTYGVLSVKTFDDKHRLKFYNLIRTKDGWRLFHRNEYIRNVLDENPEAGWHPQVPQMYNGIINKGVKMPNINLSRTRALQTLRNKYHYDILSESSMRYTGYQDKLGPYLDFLPLVIETLQINLYLIKKLYLQPRSFMEKRFNELLMAIPKIYTDNSIPLPDNFSKLDRQEISCNVVDDEVPDCACPYCCIKKSGDMCLYCGKMD